MQIVESFISRGIGKSVEGLTAILCWRLFQCLKIECEINASYLDLCYSGYTDCLGPVLYHLLTLKNFCLFRQP